jgi:CRP-like cAMP-binding protein
MPSDAISAEEAVAIHGDLIMLSDLNMNGDREHVELFSRDDLAAMVGVRTESVSRIIAELKREHILEPLENEVYKYDRRALQKYTSS